MSSWRLDAAKVIGDSQRQIQRSLDFTKRLGLYVRAYSVLGTVTSYLKAISAGLSTFAHGTALPEDQRKADEIAQQAEEAHKFARSLEGSLHFINVFGAARDGDYDTILDLARQYSEYGNAQRPYVDPFRKLSSDLKVRSIELNGAAFQLQVDSRMPRYETATAAYDILISDALLKISGAVERASADYREAASLMDFWAGTAERYSRIAYALYFAPRTAAGIEEISQRDLAGEFRSR